MKEDFLQFIWYKKAIQWLDLKTVTGKPVQLISPGTWNFDAGPDFLNARVKIGSTIWAGHVEIHVRSSEWYRHEHQNDPNYDNVILHVVWSHDKEVQWPSGKPIPCVSLEGRVEKSAFDAYRVFLRTKTTLPCAPFKENLTPELMELQSGEMVQRRLNRKAGELIDQLDEMGGDWNRLLLVQLARALGVPKNSDAFEQLILSFPYLLLSKLSTQLLSVEALLFGQAGMLEGEAMDEYHKKLQQEYQFIESLYHLKPMPGNQWTYFRLRPASFPDLRIAQLAMLMHRRQLWWRTILSAADIKELEHCFDQLKLMHYWKNHYRFGVPSVKQVKSLGRDAVHTLLINLIPLIYTYGRYKSDAEIQARALSLLKELPAENNLVIRKFKELGWEFESALDTQAILETHKHYCKKGKCLACPVGQKILGQS